MQVPSSIEKTPMFSCLKGEKNISKFLFDIIFLKQQGYTECSLRPYVLYLYIWWKITSYCVINIQDKKKEKRDFIKPPLSCLQILPTRKFLAHTVGFSSLLSPYIYIYNYTTLHWLFCTSLPKRCYTDDFTYQLLC